VPTIIGLSNLGAFGTSPCFTDSTVNADASIPASVSRLGLQLAPGDTIADRPRVRAQSYEAGPWHSSQSCVEAFANGDDLRPSALLMPSFHHLPGTPAIDYE
jgi:hypothetical protein